MPGSNIRPNPVTLASALSLAAAYGNVGSSPTTISGARGLTLKLEEVANTEAASVKFYVSPEQAAPTAVASMFQVVGTDGAETEVTVAQNAAQMYNIGIAAEHFWMQGKGAVGTDADLTASLWGNYSYDSDKFKWESAKKTFGSVATSVGASATQIGSILDVRGLGNLTLFVTESGSVNGVITVFLATGASAPTDTTTMTALEDASSSVITFTTLADEKAAHYIGDVSADFIGLTATGNGAALQVDLYGTLDGVHA